ncbi:transposase [Rhodococcus sp. UFZ-B548]|uniref:IS110 family transposase n=1 Tax=Rhodococcus sp. UFZ-B548 TaxID=2742212 RepID=UPI0015F67549|nr:transposase [Rhodococcus sp. UFZ-B548]
MSEPIYDVRCGIDVGKTSHYAVALAPDGQRLCGTDLPQDESRIRCLLEDLARHGRVLVVVDQPRNIGALPVAVARECGVDIAYLPGLRMRRIADLYPGRSKTDARDAFVIADAARTLPDTLLRIDAQNSVVEGLRLLAGFDADLASEENRLVNRIRSVLLCVHPALERTICRQMHRPVGALDYSPSSAAPKGLQPLHGRSWMRVPVLSRLGCGRRSPMRLAMRSVNSR